MTRPRWRKVASDLWGNKLRSLLVVASIVVGLFAVGVIANIYLVISEDMRLGYAAVNPANLQLRSRLFDEDMVDRARRIEGVRQAEGARLFNLRLASKPGEWVAVEMHAAPDQDGLQINQASLVEGQWPPQRRQIVIERYRLPDTNAQVGDFVTLELPSGKTRTLELVGVVHDQTIGAFSAGPGFFLAPVQGYVSQDTLEWLQQDEPHAFNTLYLTVEGDTQDDSYLQQISSRVRVEFDKAGVDVISIAARSSFDHPNRTYVDAIVGVLLLLGMLVVFLSAFLITNTMQALLRQQLQQIGIMKTLGARRRQIAGVYMALILIFGVIAALVSIPLAYRVSFGRVASLAYTINFVFQGERLILPVVGLQIVIALLAPQLAALAPIWQGARISVQEALSGLRQNQPVSGGRIARRLTRLRGLSRPLLISVRNAFRSRGRLVITLITLSLGGALFIGAFNVQVSLTQYIDQISRYFTADVNLTLDRSYRISKIESLLADLPGVAQVEGWAAARSELVVEDGSAGDSVQLLAPPAESRLVEPILLEGRWILPGDFNAIALNERFISRFPGLEPGDEIELLVNGKKTKWVVVGFFQLAGRSSGFLAYTSYEALSQVINQPNKAAVYRLVADQAGLTQDQQEDLGRQVEEHLKGHGVRVADMTAGHSLSSTAADGFSVLTAFLLFLAGLTALVGSIGLAGTMSMNVLERTREIGVMRAIGATDGILMKMVILEGILIGLLSWIIGSLLAFPISKALSDTITFSLFDAPSNFAITATGFAIWLGAVIVLSILASVLPARSATHLTIREVLAYE